MAGRKNGIVKTTKEPICEVKRQLLKAPWLAVESKKRVIPAKSHNQTLASNKKTQPLAKLKKE